jgi:hypothetical protein
MNTFNPFEKKLVKLNDIVVSALTELCKDENITWIESGYGGRRFGFLINDNWRKKYGYLLGTKDENFESPYANGSILEYYFKMVSNIYIISDSFAESLGLTENHLKLLRSTYYRCEEDEEGRTALFLEYKRPFGNSDVIDDVLEAFNISMNDEEGEKIDKDWEEEYKDLLDDVIVKIKNFFLCCEFSTEIEGIGDRYFDFEPTPQYLRKKKINKLLNE